MSNSKCENEKDSTCHGCLEDEGTHGEKYEQVQEAGNIPHSWQPTTKQGPGPTTTRN